MSVLADPNAAVNDLADRFWDGVLERDPMWATVLGDERFNDRWPDLGPDGRAADEVAGNGNGVDHALGLTRQTGGGPACVGSI